MKYKKGSQSVEQSVLEVIFLVIFIVSAFIVGFWITSLLSSSEQGTMESFNVLNEGIEILLGSNNASVCYEHILIDDEFVLAGFSRGQSAIIAPDTGWYFDSEVSRPEPIERCPLEGSCLAVCNVDDGAFDFEDVAERDDCSGQTLMSARSYETVQKFELATNRIDVTSLANFGGNSDLLYLGAKNRLDYLLIFKRGAEPNYIITLAKLENVENAVLDRNIMPCQSLPDLPSIPKLSIPDGKKEK